MTSQQLTSKEYFKSLYLIFYALIAGQLLFGALAFYLINSGTIVPSLIELETPFIGITVIFFAIVFWGGKALFNLKLLSCKRNKPLIVKMSNYRMAVFLRFCLLEAPAFLSVIFYMLTGNIILLIISTLITALFFTLKPGKEKAIIDLKLDPLQCKLVNTLGCIIAVAKSSV